MNKRIQILKKINNLLFKSAFEDPTEAILTIADKQVFLDINGNFRRLKINFSGNLFIYNNLPDGYHIRVLGSVLYIYNLLGKNIKEDKVLFRFDGSFNPKQIEITSFANNNIFCTINNIDNSMLINESKTNLEDDTLILLEEYDLDETVNTLRRNDIDDSSIKGLSTQKPFADGYTGKYHYNTKQKLFASGGRLSNESKPISRLGSSNVANAKNLALTYLNQLKKEDLTSVAPEKQVFQVQKKEITKEPKSSVSTKTEQVKVKLKEGGY
tara:strand:+ start:4270 stop:5076 length:807 start_codon:yes stop_codon:yes gene_type:complete